MGTRIKLLRSGDVAHLVGVSPDTIRHYERIGILRKLPRADSGYRIYPTDAVERVRMVRRGLQLGFSLAELADIPCISTCVRLPFGAAVLITPAELQQLGR